MTDNSRNDGTRDGHDPFGEFDPESSDPTKRITDAMLQVLVDNYRDNCRQNFWEPANLVLDIEAPDGAGKRPGLVLYDSRPTATAADVEKRLVHLCRHVRASVNFAPDMAAELLKLRRLVRALDELSQQRLKQDISPEVR